jgi:hypothetical protein
MVNIRKIILEEIESLEWIENVSDDPLDLLKATIQGTQFSNFEPEHDRVNNILRIPVAKYMNNQTLREDGLAFSFENGEYHIGWYEDIWEMVNNEKGELVDSDLSYNTKGDIDDAIEAIHKSSIGRDGRPYIDY